MVQSLTTEVARRFAPALGFGMLAWVVAGCSSSDSQGSSAQSDAATATETGGRPGGNGGAGTGGAHVSVGGSSAGGGNRATDAGVGDQDASHRDASSRSGMGSDAGPVDFTKAPECSAFCKKLTACGRTCDPATDCAAPSGSCDEAHLVYLGCEAQNGQFYCTADGFSVVSSCTEDASVCPPPPRLDAAAQCATTPPDAACLACAKTPCKTQYDALYSDQDLPAFTACVTDCEKQCSPPAACPSVCSSDVVVYSEYTDLLYCANIACPNSCTGVTVIF